MTLISRLTELEALTDNNRSWQAKENKNFLLALRNAWPELKLALARQEQGEGWVMVPKRVAFAVQTLVPLLEEGWDEYDLPEDQNKGGAACDELIAATREWLPATPANMIDELPGLEPAAPAGEGEK